jgi:ribosomal protein S12 methylthiotransferase accessory factor
MPPPDRQHASPVVEHYASVLSQFGDVVEFDISALDKLGIPVTSCSLAVEGKLRHHGNGYGSTVEAARVSGLGELAEGVLSAGQVAELARSGRRGSRSELVRSQGADRVVDPRTLCLPAGSPYTDGLPLTWVPMTRVRSGEPVWVPLEFVASESGEAGDGPTLIPPITNGLGAGLDSARPVTHGILEILQRHTNGLRFRALDAQSPVIGAEGLPTSVVALLDRLRAHGVEPVLKHAGTELGVCSTYVMGLDDDLSVPIRLTAGGEAAHPSAEVSLIKAILEYANSRARKAFMFGGGDGARAVAPPGYWAGLSPDQGERRAAEAMAAWRDRSPEQLRDLTAPDRSRSVAYADIVVGAVPDVSQPADLLAYLLDRLADHDVLTTTTERDGVVVAKTLVTGLEVETLSYGRIGELGVLKSLAEHLDLVRIQDGPSESHHDRVCLTVEAEERLGGPAWYSYAVAERIVGPLYPLYREPPRHSVELQPRSS